MSQLCQLQSPDAHVYFALALGPADIDKKNLRLHIKHIRVIASFPPCVPDKISLTLATTAAIRYAESPHALLFPCELDQKTGILFQLMTQYPQTSLFWQIVTVIFSFCAICYANKIVQFPALHMGGIFAMAAMCYWCPPPHNKTYSYIPGYSVLVELNCKIARNLYVNNGYIIIIIILIIPGNLPKLIVMTYVTS